MSDAGDYYRHQDRVARLLRQAISAVRALELIDEGWGYDEILYTLKRQLERAEYTGD